MTLLAFIFVTNGMPYAH